MTPFSQELEPPQNPGRFREHLVNLLSGETSKEFFGGEVPPMVRRLLEEASSAPLPRVAGILWTAQVCAPDCLPVYYLLYKFHARLRQFDLAEKAARKGIFVAAQQADLAIDWDQVEPGDADFSAAGPARFWLFSLKALAFICLRTGRKSESHALLTKIGELDKDKGLGGEVIAALLDGLAGL